MGGKGSGIVSTRTCGATTRAGKPCSKPPMIGLHRCKLHYGGSAKLKEANTREKLRQGLGKLVTAVAEDDPEVHPIVGFQMEIRRTLAAIRYYEERIAAIDEDDAFFGVTKEEDVEASEFTGTNVIREARPHAVILAWERERAHLTDLHKLWITAKLDERRLQLEASLIESLDEVITAVIVGLGKNPRDPEVRDVVRRSMLALRGSTAQIEG